MPTERRDRQNLNLASRTDRGHCSHHGQHKPADILDNWRARIMLKAQDKDVVFSKRQAHVNVSSPREMFEALNGKKALGIDQPESMKQVLKSPVRENRMRGSVRGLPSFPIRIRG